MMENNADLLSNAARALDNYRAEERRLEEQAMALQIHLQLVKEFIVALSGKAPARRGRPPKLVEQEATSGILPIADTDAERQEMDLAG